MKAKKGISLIVLVITIIVIIILAGAVILNMTKNNPMDSAKVAKLVQQRDSLESATLLYAQQIMAATQGEYGLSDILQGNAVKSAAGVTPVVKYTGITTGTALTNVTGASTTATFKVADSTVTKDTIDFALPESGVSGAYWAVDTASGKFYLVVPAATTNPTWLDLTNQSLAAFVVKLAS